MNTYLRCPAGVCEHLEQYDPAHQTDDPAVPASGDLACDALIVHLVDEHEVPRAEASYLVSFARTVTHEPVRRLAEALGAEGGEQR